MLWFKFTAIALPTFADENTPTLDKETWPTSAAITPSKVPAVTVVEVVPSYVLLETAVPVTVNPLGVI